MSSIIRGDDEFDSNIIPSGRVASAWVNFNGTGTVAIRDSYNVSSVTDNGVGDYTINYTVPMANSNYAVIMTTSKAAAAGGTRSINLVEGTQTTTSFDVQVKVSNSGNDADEQYLFAQVLSSA